MSSTLGRKTPSIAGSRNSVYSHGSTIRTLRTGKSSGMGGGGASTLRPGQIPWWRKPVLKNAFYTDLQRGSWHIGFYTVFLSIFTMITSSFDIYCLHEAAPGSSHTGYYIISFDFVYVGNPHVRNLLMMSAVLSLLGGLALLVTSVMLLDALRKEQEIAFKGWLWTMGIFTVWKWVAWFYGTIVNDNIFAYNIIMLVAWFIFNIINVFCFLCIYSLYLELNDLTKLQDLARLKMDTMSSMPASRAASAYGSRPTSPYVNRDTLRSQATYGYSQQSQHEPAYGYRQQQVTEIV